MKTKNNVGTIIKSNIKIVERAINGIPHYRNNVGIKTTYAISAYHHLCCEFESRSGGGVQHYVIKFVISLRQVDGFLRFRQTINNTTAKRTITLHIFDGLFSKSLSISIARDFLASSTAETQLCPYLDIDKTTIRRNITIIF
jgi:hypothetical protein